MARKPKSTAQIIDPATPESTAKWSDSANALAVINQEQESAVRAIAAQVGYQLPADATDPDLIQRDIAINMRRSVEACLEVGRGLAVLKTACGHGHFAMRLDVLGIDVNVAGRFIKSAKKFSNSPSTANLTKAIGNQTKLFEMLILDDEQIEELAESGQTGTLTIDDVERMSVKELRAAVRNLRGDMDAKDKVLGDVQGKLTKLQVQLKKKPIEAPTPDSIAADLVATAHEAEATACAWIEGHLQKSIAAILDHDEQNDSNHRSVLSGFIARIEDATDALRVKFALPRLKTDDPFEELPDDFLEKQGLAMPKPVNGA